MIISKLWDDFEEILDRKNDDKRIITQLKNLAENVVVTASETSTLKRYKRLSNLFYQIQEVLLLDYGSGPPNPLPNLPTKYGNSKSSKIRVENHEEISKQEYDTYIKKFKKLYKFLKKLSDLPYEESIAHKVSKKILEIVDADKSILILLDTESTEIILTTGRNYPDYHLREALTDDAISQGIGGWVIKNRQPHISENAQSDPLNTRVAKEHARKFNTGPIIVTPILLKDEIYGTLTAARNLSKEVKLFNKYDVKLMEALAYVSGVSIEHARQLKKFFDLQKQNEALNINKQEKEKYSWLLVALESLRKARNFPDLIEQIMICAFNIFVNAHQITLVYDRKNMGKKYNPKAPFYEISANRLKDNYKRASESIKECKLYELNIDENSVGFLAIAYNFPRIFSEDEEAIANSFATNVSRALKKAAMPEKIDRTLYHFWNEDLSPISRPNFSFFEGEIHFLGPEKPYFSEFGSKRLH